jgi:hypothetical protein
MDFISRGIQTREFYPLIKIEMGPPPPPILTITLNKMHVYAVFMLTYLPKQVKMNLDM